MRYVRIARGTRRLLQGALRHQERPHPRNRSIWLGGVLALDETEQIKKVFKLPKEERTTEALKIEGKNLRKLEELLSPNIVRLYKYGRVEIEWRGCKEERYYLCLAFGGHELASKAGRPESRVRPGRKRIVSR